MTRRLRRARDDDARALAEVCTRCWHESYAGIVPAEALAEITVEANESRWRGYAEHGETETWLAEDGGAPAAYVAIGPSRDEDAPDGTGEVYALMVDPPAHRRGLGRALLARAAERLAALGYERATLWVLDDYADGRAFYAACGWREEGRRERLPLGPAELPMRRLELAAPRG